MTLPVQAARSGQPASAQAYRLLERMIVTLELPPGGVTTESALIEKLGLGRTPVREAIQRLAWEGLIEIRPRAGLAITPIQAGDWVKVIDARTGVEVLLAGDAARHLHPALGARFQEAGKRMQRATANNDAESFLDADKEMDEAVAAAAENPYAARLVAPLRTHSRRFWFRYRADSSFASAARQHVGVIHAILKRDPRAAGREAEALMRLLREYAKGAARA